MALGFRESFLRSTVNFPSRLTNMSGSSCNLWFGSFIGLQRTIFSTPLPVSG